MVGTAKLGRLVKLRLQNKSVRLCQKPNFVTKRNCGVCRERTWLNAIVPDKIDLVFPLRESWERTPHDWWGDDHLLSVRTKAWVIGLWIQGQETCEDERYTNIAHGTNSNTIMERVRTCLTIFATWPWNLKGVLLNQCRSTTASTLTISPGAAFRFLAGPRMCSPFRRPWEEYYLRRSRFRQSHSNQKRKHTMKGRSIKTIRPSQSHVFTVKKSAEQKLTQDCSRMTGLE